MKKKNLIPTVFLLILLLFTALYGCSSDGKLEYENGKLKFDNDAAIFVSKDSPSNIDDYNLPFEEIGIMSYVRDIKTAETSGITHTVRFNNGRYYTATAFADGTYLFLLYRQNNDSYMQTDGFLVSKLADKTVYDEIHVGMTVDEIKALDPSAQFSSKNYSYHRFADKTVIRITYKEADGKYVVDSIQPLETSESVLDYLTESDFAKIK